jgi:excisionase family DNA binding protein
MAIEMPESIEQRLTIDQASALYGVHPATIRRWIASGRLPAYRVGRLVRIKASDLETLGKRIPNAGGQQ